MREAGAMRSSRRLVWISLLGRAAIGLTTVLSILLFVLRGGNSVCLQLYETLTLKGRVRGQGDYWAAPYVLDMQRRLLVPDCLPLPAPQSPVHDPLVPPYSLYLFRYVYPSPDGKHEVFTYKTDRHVAVSDDTSDTNLNQSLYVADLSSRAVTLTQQGDVTASWRDLNVAWSADSQRFAAA